MDHQAFAQLLGNYGEFVGAIAVVVTLAYLAVQVRQNTTGMQASSYQQWVSIHTQVFGEFMDKDFSKMVFAGCEDARNLDEGSYQQFMAYFRQYMHMQQAQYFLYRQGIIEEPIWKSNLEDIVGVYRFPGVQQWWNAGGRSGFTPEFVRLVEESEGHATMIYWDKQRGFYPSPHHVAQ